MVSCDGACNKLLRVLWITTKVLNSDCFCDELTAVWIKSALQTYTTHIKPTLIFATVSTCDSTAPECSAIRILLVQSCKQVSVCRIHARVCPPWVLGTFETVLLWAMPSPWQRGNACQGSRGAGGTARNWRQSYAAPLASVFVPRIERQSVTVCLQACGCGQVRPTQIPVFLGK